ncbi:MAG: Na-translocating system protein MpsB, partial [Reyranella sp.]|nr:Na-translocating system protein MpsB [Reyranella sp.]
MTTTTILQAADRAARAIPPLWPLASSVAVNPFLGQTGEPLATASARLRRTAGIALTMPRSWYAARLRSGEIADEDLQAAFDAAPQGQRPKTLAALKQAAEAERPASQAIPTVAELARDLSAIDWPRLVEERISHFASAYFDQGQALWIGGPARGAYAAWRAVATHDLTPEIVGLEGFAQTVADAPADAGAALEDGVARLGLSGPALESYFHRLLTTLGGWAQVARYRLWQAELGGGTNGAVTDLLAIRITWEAALLRQYGPALEAHWQAAIAAHAEPATATPEDVVDTILQEAAERAAQRRLHALLGAMPSAPAAPGRPALQMAFCIDVRSEVFRRALESVDPGIRTLGFAGFFGLRLGHRRFASDVVEDRLPVLLTPTLLTCSGTATPATESADRTARIAARAQRAWGRFKLAAISSFAFVEAAGPLYVGKLLSDGLALKRHTAQNDPAPRPAESLDHETRLAMAASVLKAMSLTDGFARLVLLTGHGANVVNNPHASALHCGACGGYSGEVNARLLAVLLNDREIRSGLAAQGIAIPDDTLFLGALHDTTTDAVTIYADDHPSAAHANDLAQAGRWLKSAG